MEIFMGIMDLMEKLVVLAVMFFLIWAIQIFLSQEKEAKDLSLTCHKCGELSRPIKGTGNRYKCEHCGRQFVSDYHNIDF